MTTSTPGTRSAAGSAAAGLPRRRPAEPAATPYHHITWARTWRHVSTEDVTASHLMQWPLVDGTHHLQVHRVGTSPLWNAVEGDAGVPPVWRGPVTYGGTLYAEYGGLPGAPAAVLAEAVDRGLAQARAWDTSALVITNLSAAENTRWQQARAPHGQVRLYWSHRVYLPATVEEFTAVDTPHRKARRDMRRQWRRGTEAGLRLRILHGRDILPHLPKITSFARETSQRHGPALYGLDMLAPLAEHPGAYAVVADHPDGIAGAFLAFRGSEDGGTDYLWTAAIDQTRSRDLSTYAWLMYSAIDYACQSGAAVLDAGRGNYEYKARIGFSRHPLTCLIYLTRTDPGLQGRLQAMDAGVRVHAAAAWADHAAPPSGPAPAQAPPISTMPATTPVRAR